MLNDTSYPAKQLEIQLPLYFRICFDENLKATIQQEGASLEHQRWSTKHVASMSNPSNPWTQAFIKNTLASHPNFGNPLPCPDRPSSKDIKTEKHNLCCVASGTPRKVTFRKGKVVFQPSFLNFWGVNFGGVYTSHVPYIIHHTSYIIHHTSYIIHHTSYIKHPIFKV